MTDASQAFIDHSRTLLTDSYLPRVEKAIEGLTVENIWWRANDQSNSIGNLILHLCGNARQWIVSGIGGEPDIRERPKEFSAQQRTDIAGLVDQLRATVAAADRVLANLDASTLLESRRIQTYDMTVLRTIYTVIEHFSMHSGQILLLAKMFKGDLGLYDLSSGNPRPTWRGGVKGH